MTRNYLEALVVVMVAAAVGYFMVWPKFAELQDAKLKVAEKNAELENQRDYYASLTEIAADLDRNSAGLKKIETALPANSDAPALMNFAQAAAMQSGLVLESIDYSGAKGASIAPEAGVAVQEGSQPVYSLASYDVSAALSGSYANFKDFLSRIEHSSRLIRVEAVSVNVRGDSQNENAKSANAGEAGEALNYTVKMAADFYR